MLIKLMRIALRACLRKVKGAFQNMDAKIMGYLTTAIIAIVVSYLVVRYVFKIDAPALV